MLSASPAVTGDPTAIWSWRPYGISIRRSQRSERRSWFSPRRLERYTRALHKKLNLTFNILTDQHLKVAEQFRLVFTLPDYLRDLYKSFGTALDRFHDEPEYRLPMPARYIIDKEGIIRAADVNADYTIRTEPSQTLSELRRMAG